MISSLGVGATSPAAAQSETEPSTAVGYVASVDGDLLVLTNVPTVAPGRVFKLGGGAMFITDPAGGEGAAAPAEGEARMFVRRDGEAVPATPEEAAAAEEAARQAADAGADGEKEEPRRMMMVRSDDSEGAADAAKDGETEAEGETHVMVAGPGAVPAGGTWTTDEAGGEGLAVTDIPLELQELRLAADVAGRDYLMPGLQVRVHFEGEGEDRVVSRVELIVPEEPQQ